MRSLPALLEQAVGGGDAVRAAGQRDDTVRGLHFGRRRSLKRCRENEEAGCIGDAQQHCHADDRADDPLPYSFPQRYIRRHCRVRP